MDYGLPEETAQHKHATDWGGAGVTVGQEYMTNKKNELPKDELPKVWAIDP